MLKSRVIPCLLLRDGGLVKTVRFKGSNYIGDPINAVRIFNEKCVDELIFLDIDASKKQKEPDLALIKDLATECFMPFAYGGGVTTINQIRSILETGVEKVVLNNHILTNSSFLKEAVSYFGGSTIIAAIDIRKDLWSNYKVYNHVTKKNHAVNPVEYAIDLEGQGVGEIFLNNVDRDGTFNGLDVEIIKRINDKINTPLIACGGVSSLADIKNAINLTNVGAVAVGSLFVYNGPHKAVLISYPTSTELELSN